MKIWKKGKTKISILISIHTVHFAFLKVYTKFENTDKQYVAVLLLHNTTHHYLALYQISES